MSTDAIVILKDEHQQIRREFRAYQRTTATQSAVRGEIADKIIGLLTAHTYIENEVMYPRVRVLVPTLERDVLESYEEHHVADLLVAEIDAMEPYEERFDAKMSVLIENVQHHMDEEERDWFPRVREALGRKALQEIGRELLRARENAPSGPAQPNAITKAFRPSWSDRLAQGAGPARNRAGRRR
jgi:hemerythrin-like domain-containing protein